MSSSSTITKLDGVEFGENCKLADNLIKNSKGQYLELPNTGEPVRIVGGKATTGNGTDNSFNYDYTLNTFWLGNTCFAMGNICLTMLCPVSAWQVSMFDLGFPRPATIVPICFNATMYAEPDSKMAGVVIIDNTGLVHFRAKESIEYVAGNPAKIYCSFHYQCQNAFTP